jgi:hypothetical protein
LIRTDHKGYAWLGKTMEQPSSGRAVEILPTGLKAQLGYQTHLRMMGLMANRRYGFIPAAIHQKPAGSAGLVEQVFDPSVKDMAQMGRAAGLLQMPKQRGCLPVEGQGLQPGGKGWGLPVGVPLPQLIEAHLLKPLRPQKSLTLAIEQGGCGDPTGHTPGALDGFAHQGFHDLSIGREKGASGLGQGQMIHLPAGASSVKTSGHD